MICWWHMVTPWDTDVAIKLGIGHWNATMGVSWRYNGDTIVYNYMGSWIWYIDARFVGSIQFAPYTHLHIILLYTCVRTYGTNKVRYGCDRNFGYHELATQISIFFDHGLQTSTCLGGWNRPVRYGHGSKLIVPYFWGWTLLYIYTIYIHVYILYVYIYIYIHIF